MNGIDLKKKMRNRKVVILLSISVLLLFGCGNEVNEDLIQNDIKEIAIDQSFEEDSTLLSEFYTCYSLILRSPDKDSSLTFNTLQLDSLWKRILSRKVQFVDYVLQSYSQKESLYGENFKKNVGVKRLPNNIHALFWIEALYKEDYLMGRRVNMGEFVFPYLQSCVAIFPIIENEDGTELPFFERKEMYSQKDIINVFPEFSPEYLNKIDSYLEQYSQDFNANEVVKSTGLKWMDYNNVYSDDLFEQFTQIPDTLLGKQF